MSSPTQLVGEPEDYHSRARHSRESTARAAAQGGISRESVRKAKVIHRDRPDLEALVGSGEITLGAAYLQTIGENRVPLYLKVPTWVNDVLLDCAEASGVSRQAFIIELLEVFAENQEDTHP